MRPLAMVQDARGLLYLANERGISVFDGVSWETVPLPNGITATAMGIDQHGIPWVGGDGELGYLAPDTRGTLQYHSLKDSLPKDSMPRGRIREVFPIAGGALFVGGRLLYRWENDAFRIVECPGRTTGAARVGNRIFLSLKDGLGKAQLMEYASEGFSTLTEGPAPLVLETALPHKEGILLGLRDQGLFLYSNSSLSKMESTVDGRLTESAPYRGIPLSDETYALGMQRGGILIMDNEGSRLGALTQKDGLPSDTVLGMVMTPTGNLWLAHPTGLTKVGRELPFTLFDKTTGLGGKVQQLLRHQGILYVATTHGLFVLEEDTGDVSAHFRPVGTMDNLCHSLLSLSDRLLVGSSAGVFELSEGTIRKVASYTTARVLLASRQDPNRVFIGHSGGLSSLYLQQGRWLDQGEVLDTTLKVTSIVEDDPGVLWLGTGSEGVLRLTFTELQKGKVISDANMIVDPFDPHPNASKGVFQVWRLRDTLLAINKSTDGSAKKVFRFDREQDEFLACPNWGEHLGSGAKSCFPITYGKDRSAILYKLPEEDGASALFSASKDSTTDRYISKRIYYLLFKDRLGEVAFWDRDHVLWLGGRGLVRYDLGGKPPETSGFKALIRNVAIGRDSLVFGGAGTLSNTQRISYTDNDIRIHYAAPYAMSPNTVEYQVKLDRSDTDWSPWTLETRKDYTYLREGTYQFRVRARNSFGQVSEMGTFDLRVLPPWYRTLWAYLFYVLMVVLLFYGALRWRSYRLMQDKRRLEGIIAENVAEIQHQAEQLKELDRAKSRFFANISHEFRTPMTLLVTPLEQLLKDEGHTDMQNASMMLRNAKRMGRLIDQLLQLARIESGKLSLQVDKGDIMGFLRPLVSQFSSHAEEKDIDYSFQLNPANYYDAYFDADKMEKMVYNLVSNAIKFTPPGSAVEVEVAIVDARLRIRVSDTGPGIPQEALPHIFDRFYRVEGVRHPGTGIGLALTKELAELHYGDIRVRSRVNEGSVFTLRIPIARTAYDCREIQDTPPTALQEESPSTISDAAVEHEDSTAHRPLLLLVEDNEDLRTYIPKTLGMDFRMLLAENGEQGIALATEHIPDIIISDVMMPKKDGIALCAFLKADERTSHIPIVLLTAKASVESRLQGLGIGADAYLTKPFSAEELSLKVRNLYRQQEILRERYSRMVVLKPTDMAITSGDEAFLKRAMEVVERHMDNATLSMGHFCSEMGMGRTQLHLKLKALTGLSTTQFIRSQRLKRAATLLAEGSATVSEVGYGVGFVSLTYFAKSFREQYGINPSEYRSKKGNV